MDKLTNYRSTLKRLLSDLAALWTRSDAHGIETQCVFDDERDRYLLISADWQGDRRQRGTHVFARIRDGKIWIEDDWTEEGVAIMLVKAGVPKEDIVLGFQPPKMRKFTEFAVA